MTIECDAQFELTVGIMLVPKVRDFLKKCQFEGMKIEFIESSGWFAREFIVKGKCQDVQNVADILKKWAKENDLK